MWFEVVSRGCHHQQHRQHHPTTALPQQSTVNPMVAPFIRPDLDQLPAYVPGKSDPTALKLSSNEMSQGPLPTVTEALNSTVENPATSLNRYPDMAGVQLRMALADFLNSEATNTKTTNARNTNPAPLTLENVALGCGSSALCLQLVQIACSSASDEVIFPWRSFEAYPILTRIAGATPVPIPLRDHRNDLEAMVTAVTDDTRLVFICNPNNPTGTMVSAEDIERFLAQIPPHIIVALDEAYIELAAPSQSAGPGFSRRLIDSHNNLVVLRTFSKVYGLAGLRVGYAFGSTHLIGALNKVAVPFAVNALGQAAALASLQAQDELRTRVREVQCQRVRLTQTINDATSDGTVVADSQANFVWVPASHAGRLLALVGSVPSLSNENTLDDESLTLTAALAERGILVRCFAGEGVRITVTTEQETNQLLRALNLV